MKCASVLAVSVVSDAGHRLLGVAVSRKAGQSRWSMEARRGRCPGRLLSAAEDDPCQERSNGSMNGGTHAIPGVDWVPAGWSLPCARSMSVHSSSVTNMSDLTGRSVEGI